MTTDPVSLDDLIEHVVQVTPADPLAQLSQAVATSAQLSELSDHLIGHFVDQARLAGASWTDVGQHMGVSKQAVQKRFVSRDDDEDFPAGGRLSRLTKRATAVIGAARSAARDNGSDEVHNEHIVIGLLSEPVGLAARSIVALGGSPDDIRTVMGALVSPGGRAKAKRAHFNRGAKKTIELSLREAVRLGHPYIGTEHLLLGLLRNQGEVATGVLVGLGINHDAVEAWVLAELEAIRAVS
jgi:hypothetical protein